MPFHHANYMVYVEKYETKLKWLDLIAKNRVANQNVKKILILFINDNGYIIQFKFYKFFFRNTRFIANQIFKFYSD